MLDVWLYDVQQQQSHSSFVSCWKLRGLINLLMQQQILILEVYIEYFLDGIVDNDWW